MRTLIGCSGATTVVAFIIGLAASLFVQGATWTDRLTIALLPASMTFVAVLLLASRDSARRSATMRSVRKHLLTCGDTSDDEFLASPPSENAVLLLAARKAVSHFFDVPMSRIGRDIHLIDDLHVDKLEPSFQFCVVESVVASQHVKLQPFGFSMGGLDTIDDLAEAKRKVLDGFDDATDTRES